MEGNFGFRISDFGFIGARSIRDNWGLLPALERRKFGIRNSELPTVHPEAISDFGFGISDLSARGMVERLEPVTRAWAEEVRNSELPTAPGSIFNFEFSILNSRPSSLGISDFGFRIYRRGEVCWVAWGVVPAFGRGSGRSRRGGARAPRAAQWTAFTEVLGGRAGGRMGSRCSRR